MEHLRISNATPSIRKNSSSFTPHSNDEWNKHLGSDLTYSVIHKQGEDPQSLDQVIQQKVNEGIKQAMS